MAVLPRGWLRRWMAWAALILAGAAFSFVGYFMGLRQAGFDRATLAALETRIRFLGAEAEEAQRRLVETRIGGEVNEQAKVDLQAELNARRGEILALREKVALYEALLSSESKSAR